MVRQANSLDGMWSGEYWYAGGVQRTPFSAWLVERGDALSGTTVEPNTFAEAASNELTAVLDGVRTGFHLQIWKVYDPAPGVHDLPIHYEGEVEADFRRITGVWRFPGLTVKGGFDLVRAWSAAEVGAQASATTGDG